MCVLFQVLISTNADDDVASKSFKNSGENFAQISGLGLVSFAHYTVHLTSTNLAGLIGTEITAAVIIEAEPPILTGQCLFFFILYNDDRLSSGEGMYF